MGYGLAVFGLVVWGLAVIPIKLARAPGRLGIMVSMPAGLITLAIIGAATGQLKAVEATGWDWTLIFLVGLCHFALGGAAYYEAIQAAGITTASPMTRLSPLIVVLVAAAVGLGGLSWMLVVAAGLAIPGGILLSKGSAVGEDHPNHKAMKRGVALALVTAVLWAGGNLFVVPIGAGVPKLLVTILALGCGIAFYGTIMGSTGRLRGLKTLTRRDIVCYSVHGVISYAAAYWASFVAIDMLGVGKTSVITGAWPAVAVVAGVVVFREKMNAMKTVGAILLIGGALLAAMG